MREDVQKLLLASGETEAIIKSLQAQQFDPVACLDMQCRVDIKKAKTAIFTLSQACDRLVDKLNNLNQQILHEEAERCSRKITAQSETWNRRMFEFAQMLQEAREALGFDEEVSG